MCSDFMAGLTRVILCPLKGNSGNSTENPLDSILQRKALWESDLEWSLKLNTVLFSREKTVCPNKVITWKYWINYLTNEPSLNLFKNQYWQLETIYLSITNVSVIAFAFMKVNLKNLLASLNNWWHRVTLKNIQQSYFKLYKGLPSSYNFYKW